jgi:transcriptional regulator with XRE-family HTH domain
VLVVVESADNEHIGAAVAALRGGRSQASVAEDMRELGHEKWSQSTVWAVEKGTRPLRLSEANDLAGIFGCPLSDFLKQPPEVAADKVLNRHVQRVRSSYKQAVDALTGLELWRTVLDDTVVGIERDGTSIDSGLARRVRLARLLTVERAGTEARAQAQAQQDEARRFESQPSEVPNGK